MVKRATTTPSLTPIFDAIAAEMGVDWDEETSAHAAADPGAHPSNEDVQLAS